MVNIYIGQAAQQLSQNLFRFVDTCNVYIIRNGREAVLIDFGSGDVLDHLHELDIDKVTDVLMTHHHRDQGQGLARAIKAGIRIWVPYTEQDLFSQVDTHWQAREIYLNYLMRQDRFSLLEPVPIDGVLEDYAVCEFGGRQFTVVPTPGHTIGSVTLMVEVDKKQIAFTGDLIAAPGKVWSLSATQWSYNGAEGVAASIPSLLDLKERQPDMLLPSHGHPMNDPEPAIDLLVERLWQLLQQRRQNLRLFENHERPYEPITPHLLRHRASFANSYVLLSDSGKALMIDFGYDFATSLPVGNDRASRRPWLYTIPTLKRQFNLESIDVVIPTHFHDDHVAGINLLSRVESTQVWAAETFADILEKPSRYDLPCLWYEPIRVHSRLPLEIPFQWEEYTFILHPLRGHTRYAVAIEFEVDGYKVLATGDQYQGEEGLEYNYVYANRFGTGDYIKSAELYQRIHPDLILTGHWQPLWVTAKYLKQLGELGIQLEQLHRDLLLQSPGLGEEGFLARLTPYQVTASRGETIEFQAEVYNPYPHPAEAVIQLVIPARWKVVDGASSEAPSEQGMTSTIIAQIEAFATHTASFQIVLPSDARVRRARIAVDITTGGQRFGQQAEALVTVTP
jgi:glyoxylase-like metal-dependent hydrolase (beta-lactamase superfamily II)